MPRRTIESLIAKYILEPTIRDVYVEGPCDRDVIRWALTLSGNKNAQILEIDTVEVPVAKLLALGYTDGNRQRVLALAAILEQRLGAETRQVSCIVDTDCDSLLGVPIPGAFVLPTDYTCMEMYLFENAELERFLVLALGRDAARVAAIIAHYVFVLQELFLIRAANQTTGLGLPWLDFTKCCEIDGDELRFNIDEFVNRLLNEGQLRDHKGDLLAMVDSLRARMRPEPRHQMHGHDFVRLLTWHSRRCVPRAGLNEKALLIMLLHGADMYRILGHEMFRALQRRLA